MLALQMPDVPLDGVACTAPHPSGCSALCCCAWQGVSLHGKDNAARRCPPEDGTACKACERETAQRMLRASDCHSV